MPEPKQQSAPSPAPPSKGFQLPTPPAGGEQKPAPGGQPGTTTQVPVPPKQTGTLTRDISIGIGILIGCMIIFLFAKKKYANWLVQNRKNPKSANAAGLWLFLLLTCLAAMAIFPLLSSETFLTAIFLGAVGGLALISLIFTVIKSR